MEALTEEGFVFRDPAKISDICELIDESLKRSDGTKDRKMEPFVSGCGAPHNFTSFPT